MICLNSAAMPNCGGEPKIIAAILETQVMERILENLGLPGTGLLSWEPISRSACLRAG